MEIGKCYKSSFSLSPESWSSKIYQETTDPTPAFSPWLFSLPHSCWTKVLCTRSKIWCVVTPSFLEADVSVCTVGSMVCLPGSLPSDSDNNKASIGTYHGPAAWLSTGRRLSLDLVHSAVRLELLLHSSDPGGKPGFGSCPRGQHQNPSQLGHITSLGHFPATLLWPLAPRSCLCAGPA